MGFFKSIFKKARRRKDKDRNNRDTIVLPFQNPPPQSPPPWDQTQPSHAPRSDTSFPPPTQLHSWQLHTVPEESRSNYSSPVPDPPAHPAHVRPPSNTSQQHGGSKSRVESHLTIDADARPPTWFFQRPVWPHPQRRPREKSVATHITLPRQSRAPTWFFQRPVWPMPKSEKHHDVVEAEDQPSWVHHRPVWPEPQSSRPKESVVVQRPPSNEEPRRVSREQSSRHPAKGLILAGRTDRMLAGVSEVMQLLPESVKSRGSAKRRVGRLSVATLMNQCSSKASHLTTTHRARDHGKCPRMYPIGNTFNLLPLPIPGRMEGAVPALVSSS
ncbi:hypothetical protein BOTBODRAFT_213241 [Botryobasidium botryosum FD-172 SS1]|uniref:Uncharacterized protein n=1 Tax=Botryobasidium botryosum (strain FD-172 SS1) TaxID=930990 RepID=A0A067N1A4_BOTB1|nr:hypothetical protein BOTBODRAFT_213241 [Botryobasidium botryosum FD-172 SS1]